MQTAPRGDAGHECCLEKGDEQSAEDSIAPLIVHVLARVANHGHMDFPPQTADIDYRLQGRYVLIATPQVEAHHTSGTCASSWSPGKWRTHARRRGSVPHHTSADVHRARNKGGITDKQSCQATQQATVGANAKRRPIDGKNMPPGAVGLASIHLCGKRTYKMRKA